MFDTILILFDKSQFVSKLKEGNIVLHHLRYDKVGKSDLISFIKGLWRRQYDIFYVLRLNKYALKNISQQWLNHER